MGHYLVNFAIYTMAMIGLICFALVVYKKFSLGAITTKRKGILKIEDALGLSPRKTLYIIKAGEERFLISADIDRTNLISKLNLKDTTTSTLDEIDKINLANQGVEY